MQDIQKNIKEYIARLKGALDALDTSEMEAVFNVLTGAYDKDKMIILMGNGGSASTASHIVCDLGKGVGYGRQKRFKMISLNDNLPMVLAYANDVSYDDIFVEQLKNFLEPDCVVIGISGSGNSKNIIKAIKYANEKGAITVGLCGYDGGELKRLAKYSIHAKVDDMQISEDLHLITGHILMKLFNSTLK